MEDLIQILTDGLLKLREDLDNLPNYEEDIKKINELIATIQANQLSEADIKNLVVLLATGYFATQKEDYTKLMSDLSTKLNEDNQALIKSEIDNLSTQADLLINKAIATIKQDLTAFKATIKNGRDGLDGLDGRNGKDGINGANGLNGKDGKNGLNGSSGIDGIGIQDIIYKSNNLIITLTDGTTKTIKFNIPTQFVGGGGGVHEDRVIELINEAISGGGGGDIELKTINGESLKGTGNIDLSTNLVMVGNEIRYTNIDGTLQTLDMSPYLDDTTNTVVSAILDGTNIIFTREDETTFVLDVSNLYDDTNIVTSVNGQTGSISITPTSLNVYTKLEIDTIIGDINSALDTINGEVI